MAEVGGMTNIFNLLVQVAWIFLDLVIAVVVLWRFKASATGLLVGGGHVLIVLKSFLSLLVYQVVFRIDMPPPEAYTMAMVVFRLASVFCYMLVAAGIAFIPRSLRKLSEKR